MASEETARNRFRELFPPLLLLFSLLDGARLFEGKHILGIPFNVNLSDVGMITCLVLYVFLYRKEIVASLPGSSMVLYLAIVFLVVTFAGGFISNPYWMISFKYWIKIYVLFGVLVVLFRTSRISHTTIYLFCGLFLFLNLVGILECFYRESQSMQDLLVIFRTPESLAGSSSVSSIFVNQNIYGVLNGLFLITLVSIYFNYPHMINKAALIAISILCAVGIFLSTSRNALFTTIFGGLFLALPVLKMGRGLKTLFTIVIIIIVLFIVSVKIMPNYAQRLGRVFPVITKLENHQAIDHKDFRIELSKESRVSIWKTGLEKAMDRPVLGWGNCMAFFHLKPITKHDHLHNAFIEILYSNGIVGFTLFMALLALWLAKLRSVWCWPPVAATLFMSMFETFFVIAPWVVFTAWLVAFTTKDLADNGDILSVKSKQTSQDSSQR